MSKFNIRESPQYHYRNLTKPVRKFPSNKSKNTVVHFASAIRVEAKRTSGFHVIKCGVSLMVGFLTRDNKVTFNRLLDSDKIKKNILKD